MLAALFAPLAVLVAVAVMTWRAEQRYRAVTQRVIHDYAAIAAWQYARRANNALHHETMHAFRGIADGHQRTSGHEVLVSPALILSAAADSVTTLLAHARFAFSFDVAGNELKVSGGAVDDATRGMLIRRLTQLAGSARPDPEPHRVLFDSSGGQAHAIALWILDSPDGPMRGAYGVVADAAALAPVFSGIVADANMFPGTSAGAGLTASDLAIRLRRADGGTVFATANPLGATAAEDTAGLKLSELRAGVDIPPQAANALLVGGAPRSQLPALALMIAIAAALAVFGVRHERRARELARLRTRFVTNVSHELRTPLAHISMFAETLMLGRERNEGERTQFAAIIVAEARRLTALVESVLRFSRGEGDTGVRLERVVVSDEVESAAEAFAPIADAADARVTVSHTAPAFAQLDRGAIRQIMLNLLDNAVKHGGRGTRIDVSIIAGADDVRIQVDDSGPGVPADWRERVFEPFVRVENGAAAGAGIGLAVVHDLVTAHRGRVWIEESPLGGARFIVAIPVAGVVPATEAEPTAVRT